MQNTDDEQFISDDNLDGFLDANSDSYTRISPDSPLFFDVTFYKKFGTVRNPKNGKFMDVDIVTCFEFPQFVCMTEADAFVREDAEELREMVLSEFLEYLKIKASAFAHMITKTKGMWTDNVTFRFSVASTT
jgi:hypothetical protein